MLWIRTGFRIVRKEDSSDQKYETAPFSVERIEQQLSRRGDGLPA